MVLGFLSPMDKKNSSTIAIPMAVSTLMNRVLICVLVIKGRESVATAEKYYSTCGLISELKP